MSARKVPSDRLHKARGMAVVTIDGKDVYLGEYNSPESKARYDALIAEWLCRIHEPPSPEADCSLSELMAAYLIFASEYDVKNGKHTREFGCISEALRELRKLHGEIGITDFGPRALKALQSQMVDLGWCRKYINKQIGRIVRQFLAFQIEKIHAPTVHVLRIRRNNRLSSVVSPAMQSR